MKFVHLFLGVLLVLFFSSCNKSPVCNIVSPLNGEVIPFGKTININVNATDEDGLITKVILYLDNKEYDNDLIEPYFFEVPEDYFTYGEHEIKIKAIDDKGVETEESISITIVPGLGCYYHVGNVEGIVFEISKDGLHGKILSMNEATKYINDGLLWSTESVKTNANSMSDGLSNLNIIKNKFDINNYPAFKWCNDLNVDGVTGWNLPAINELQAIGDAYDIINASLDSNGGQKLTRVQNYCSSTEFDDSFCYAYNFTALKSGKVSKTDKLRIRAVKFY